ncbi:hypothetical protein LIER_26087 [Lithospermum erythrorhizon]|uniref:Uncharacterized protein n=1 Tax=Lithospermum erythrorhizon TaxID=34254 RepID=A0AAV3R7E6_LITER
MSDGSGNLPFMESILMLIKELFGPLVVDDKPWLIGGDFNIVKNSSESVRGELPDSQGMWKLNECISSINVMEKC